MSAITHALAADASGWAPTAAHLLQRSPLMRRVVFEQIRRARQTEAARGIRTPVNDKVNAPSWQPRRSDGVTPDMLQPFFSNPGWHTAIHCGRSPEPGQSCW